MCKFLGLKASDLFNVIFNSIIATTAIFAICISTCQYKYNTKREDLQGRPIIAVSGQYFSYNLPYGTSFQPIQKMQNYGSRPAYNCEFTIITSKESLISNKYSSELDKYVLAVANPIVPNVSFALGNHMIFVKDSTKYCYKILLKYDDKISGVTFKDSLYFYWDFIKKNIKDTAFFQVHSSEIREARVLDSLINSQ